MRGAGGGVGNGWGDIGPRPPGWDGDVDDQGPEEPAEVLRGGLVERAEGQNRPRLPLHTLSRALYARFLPVEAEAMGPPDNALLPPPPAQSPPPVGPRRRTAGALQSARALPSPSPGPALQRRVPNAMSARRSFQEELSAKRSEIPGRNLLRRGSPHLLGTQEPRQGCQEQQLGRRRRRRHPGPPRAGPAAPPSRRRASRRASATFPPQSPRAPTSTTGQLAPFRPPAPDSLRGTPQARAPLTPPPPRPNSRPQRRTVRARVLNPKPEKFCVGARPRAAHCKAGWDHLLRPASFPASLRSCSAWL